MRPGVPSHPRPKPEPNPKRPGSNVPLILALIATVIAIVLVAYFAFVDTGVSKSAAQSSHNAGVASAARNKGHKH